MWKKIWAMKSTTVRDLVTRQGLGWLQSRSPEMVAALVQSEFTRVRSNPLPQLGQAELPQRRWHLMSEGHPLMVYAWGDPQGPAPLALLAHGWNSNAWELFPVVEKLRGLGYTVVAFDQTGHGLSGGKYSSFPQFARNLERVGRSLPHLEVLVGHSMGGAAGALALTRGLRAERVVLLAPPADVRIYLGRFTEWLGLSDAVAQALQRRLELQEKVDLDRLVPEELVARLTQPALILCDEGDRETGLVASQRYAERWPGARLVVTRGLGHRRILQDEVVLQHCADFLNGSIHQIAAVK